MKKLLVITLVTAIGTGSILQLDARSGLVQVGTYKGQVNITNPKKLQKMIRDMKRKIEQAQKQNKQYASERTAAANKGNKRRVLQLNQQISEKLVEIGQFRSQRRRYIMDLATLKKKPEPKHKK